MWSNNQDKEVISKLNDLGVLTSRYDIYQDVMNPAYYNLVSYIHEDWLPQAYPNDIATYKDGSFVQAWGYEFRADNKGFSINDKSMQGFRIASGFGKLIV